MPVWIRSCRLALVLWAVVSILVVGGCKRKSPTEPEPPPPALPQIPGPVRLVDFNLPDRTVVVEWNNSPGAQSYTVAYDSADGRQQIETDGNTIRIALTNLATDQPSNVQVQARNQAGTSGVATATFLIPNFQDVVEALFFGTGPYGETDAPWTWDRENMFGWAFGTDVRVRVDQTLDSAQFDNLTRFLQEVAGLTLGALHGHVAEIGNISEQRIAGEIKVIVREDISGPCQNPDAAGCASMLFIRPFFHSGLLWVRPRVPPFVLSHELGHAIGLNHVVMSQLWQVAGQPLPTPTMRVARVALPSPGEQTLSPLEAEILNLVYGSGLRPGASRGEFYGRGLIRNATPSFSGVRSRGRQIMTVPTQDGSATVSWVCPY